MTEEEWDALPQWVRREIMEDVAMTMEIDADLEHNPLFAEVATLWSELGYPAGSHRLVDAPGTRRAPSGRWLEEPPLFGAEYTIRTDDVDTETRTAWFPNFRAPGLLAWGWSKRLPIS